jgi:hypothetical protein
MRIVFSLSGTARQVDQDVLHQCKELKKQHPESAALIMALRDEIRSNIRPAKSDDIVTVQVTFDSGYSMATGRDDPPPQDGEA